jgi:hypothetical protein
MRRGKAQRICQDNIGARGTSGRQVGVGSETDLQFVDRRA